MCRRKIEVACEKTDRQFRLGHTYTDVTSFKIPNNNDNHTMKSTALEKNKGKN